MKKIYLSLFLSTFLFSCSETELNLIESDVLNLNNETQTDSYFQDIDDLISGVVGLSDASFSGRSSTLDERFCATAKVSLFKKVKSDPDSIVVDFSSEGCIDKKGNTRTGKLIVVFNGDRLVSHTVTFVNFFVNGNKVEGTRVVNRTSLIPPTSNILLTNGKITWADGTFATREMNITRIWNRGLVNPLDDNMIVKQGSTAAGINRLGKEYSVEVLSDIVLKFGCGSGVRPVLIPVSGTKVITINEKTILIDFGNGECDTKVSVIIDGKTKEVDLKRDLD